MKTPNGSKSEPSSNGPPGAGMAPSARPRPLPRLAGLRYSERLMMGPEAAKGSSTASGPGVPSAVAASQAPLLGEGTTATLGSAAGLGVSAPSLLTGAGGCCSPMVPRKSDSASVPCQKPNSCPRAAGSAWSATALRRPPGARTLPLANGLSQALHQSSRLQRLGAAPPSRSKTTPGTDASGRRAASTAARRSAPRRPIRHPEGVSAGKSRLSLGPAGASAKSSKPSPPPPDGAILVSSAGAAAGEMADSNPPKSSPQSSSSSLRPPAGASAAIP
mmetsp:Transcript_11326/g.26847  ORF Transcript_11326/g.26847 Transcript_11326/m.26847 type:complete len:275 (+) Transcript_11326:858-1682(+)